MGVTAIPIVISVLGTVSKSLQKKAGTIDFNIAEIRQNTETSPGDPRRLTVNQSSKKDHQLKLM